MDSPKHSRVNRLRGNRPFIPRFGSQREICIVWRANMESEFRKLRQVIQKYKYVAIDTEFPGLVIKLQNENSNKSPSEMAYNSIKSNVDTLKLIQLGMSFFDDKGNTSKKDYGYSTWQFNFKFDLDNDLYAPESIELLKNSGIQFEKHRRKGIQHVDFAELLMASGIILTDDVTFIAFHACYDIAYLMKSLTNNTLSEDEREFISLVKIYFPTIYDVERLARKTRKLYGGLQSIGDQLAVPRIGTSHQAGSDALLTGNIFFKIKSTYYNNVLDPNLFSGYISGLSVRFRDVE